MTSFFKSTSTYLLSSLKILGLPLVPFTFISCTPVFAQSLIEFAPGGYFGILQDAQNRLAHVSAQGAVTSESCQGFYQNLFADRMLTITAAIGYFDESSGQDPRENYVADTFARSALEDALTSRCRQGNFACGFKRRSANQFQKKVRTRYAGDITVIINLAHSSVSSNDYDNKTTYKAQQQKQSNLARATFFGGIQAGTDVALYMGHARSGGGPDFYPVRLLKNGKPDYGYYKSAREGISSLLSSIRSAAQKPKVVGLLACKSTGLFAGSVRKAAPRSLVISAGDLFNDTDILATGLATMDNLIAERCGSRFNTGLKIRPNSASFLNVNFLP